MSLRRAQRAAERRRDVEASLRVGIAGETGARCDRQVRGVERERQRLAAQAAVAGDLASPETQGETGKGEIGAAF